MLTLLFILAETILIARGDYATEISLTQKLLNGYSKEYPSSEYTVLQLTIFINQITSIDDSNQQMKSSINIMVEWYDERLQWDTSAYNIEWVLINANSLWLPDLVILNSVSSNIFLSLDSKTLAYVYYSGVVAVIYSVPTLTTRCSMDVAKFPMDRQSCSINISSWARCENEYTMIVDGVVTEFFTENPVWYLDIKGITNVDEYAKDRFTYRNKECNMEVVALNLPLTRRPLYYMINIIFPSLILTVLTLSCYALPATLQFSLSLTIFLNYSVSSVRVASLMPVQSTNMPLVLWYFFGSMMLTLISFLWFVMDFILRSNSYLPAWTTSICVHVRSWSRSLISKLASCCSKSKIEPEVTRIDVQPAESEVKLDVEPEPGPIKNPTEAEIEKKPLPTAEPVSDCFKCQSCSKCQEKEQERKSSDHKKTEFDKNMICLNRIVFVIALVSVFIFNLACWIYIGSG